MGWQRVPLLEGQAVKKSCKAKKPSAVDIIATAKENATARGKRDWLKQLSPEHQHVMLEIKTRYAAGELNGVQYSDLHRSIKAAFGNIIGYTQFRRWLIGETT